MVAFYAVLRAVKVKNPRALPPAAARPPSPRPDLLICPPIINCRKAGTLTASCAPHVACVSGGLCAPAADGAAADQSDHVLHIGDDEQYRLADPR